MHGNVLHTITGLNVGGAEFMLARFLGGLDLSVYPSTVLSLLPPGKVAPRVEQAGARVLTLDMVMARPRPSDIVRLVRSVRKAAPDLIHGWMYHGNLAASLGAMLSLSFPPVIWSIHHTVDDIANEKPMMRRTISLLARLSSRTVAISYCSKIAADQHEKLGFDSRRRAVIPNGIDCNAFAPLPGRGTALRAMIGLPPERLVIGNVARFHPMKDQVSLVNAIGKLVSDGFDVQGVFLGEGHEDGPVRQTARELGIDERITTPGVRDDVAELLPGFDVVVQSSAWGEAFSLSLGEAMACGVPAVSTDVGDSGWMIGTTGVVVPPRDAAALAAGIAKILTLQPEERRALGQRARERVIENFSLPIYVQRHLDLYHRSFRRRPLLQGTNPKEAPR